MYVPTLLMINIQNLQLLQTFHQCIHFMGHQLLKITFSKRISILFERYFQTLQKYTIALKTKMTINMFGSPFCSSFQVTGSVTENPPTAAKSRLHAHKSLLSVTRTRLWKPHHQNLDLFHEYSKTPFVMQGGWGWDLAGIYFRLSTITYVGTNIIKNFYPKQSN